MHPLITAMVNDARRERRVLEQQGYDVRNVVLLLARLPLRWAVQFDGDEVKRMTMMGPGAPSAA